MKYLRRCKTDPGLALEAQRTLLKLGGINVDEIDGGGGRASIIQVPVSGHGGDNRMNTLKIKRPFATKDNIVILHGFGAGLGFFYRNILPISMHFKQTFAVDWLGMGLSSRPKFPKKVRNATDTELVRVAEDFFLDSLEDWRVENNLEKMNIACHSLGGYLGLKYAIKYPERVEKLALISPVGVPYRPAGLLTQRRGLLFKLYKSLWLGGFTPQALIRGLGGYGKRLVKAYASRRFSHLEQKEIDAIDSYIYHITAQRGSGEYAVSRLLLPGAFARQTLPLSELKMPTSFLYGSHDWMGYHHAVNRAHEMKVPVAVGLVHEAGHHLYIDNPEAFNYLLLKEFGINNGATRNDISYPVEYR